MTLYKERSCRYPTPISEAVTLLAARAPNLDAALAASKRAGHAFVVIDGTLIPIDR